MAVRIVDSFQLVQVKVGDSNWSLLGSFELHDAQVDVEMASIPKNAKWVSQLPGL